ncbi:hypothetical protein WOLCODRAFT_103919 [Wolfiporia cocos MD-104 SS10]|uniref:Uncharacterized protein n=1 Tax=Wolfiporia cocos (strain MD-104) TaxID=742152 RepID=A0A2H3JP34_WOLCO|nr:hypothetical protein WOLCODRAFT_103919 [Wolfiporia cocos MD-104 SS10]
MAHGDLLVGSKTESPPYPTPPFIATVHCVSDPPTSRRTPMDEAFGVLRQGIHISATIFTPSQVARGSKKSEGTTC